jgi:ABC-type transport system involved in multi-copper enzyme maturation permease subunit
MMLFYKAWLESRLRFLVGLTAITAVCILYIRLRPILVPDWRLVLEHPDWPGRPAWLFLGVHDLNFYAWHFLYENKLQQVWVLFAILLSFGGLVREKVHGTSTFSLSLPVSRIRWLMTRMLVATAESFVLGVATAFAVPLASWSIREPYPLPQVIAHCLLIVAAGGIFLALGAVFSTLIRGEHMALAATLILLGGPYLFIQAYIREAAPSVWVHRVDISHVMAGPQHLTWATTPWRGLAASFLLAISFLFVAAKIGESTEY